MRNVLIVAKWGSTVIEFSYDPSTGPKALREELEQRTNIPTERIKIMSKTKGLWKGILKDDSDFASLDWSSNTIAHLLVMGTSDDINKIDEEMADFQKKNRIRDDLTEEGKNELKQRGILGQKVLKKTARRKVVSSEYGFGKIETLPRLPQEEKAQQILNTLANDPGVIACMSKRKWKVGCLAEMYPDGKVGEDPVCVMGLNENKGQRILLRIRTDDLQGFRKIASIRQVLYHELAHNEISPHNNDFFVLMRQIERECTELDWTQGSGLSVLDSIGTSDFEGGTFRLGGDKVMLGSENVSAGELAAQAALKRFKRNGMHDSSHCDGDCDCSDMTSSPDSSL